MAVDLAQYGQKIFSEKINKHLWVVKNQRYREKFIEEGTDIPVFTWDEVKMLKGSGITPTTMAKIWHLRNVFPESNIDSIQKNLG